MKKNFAHKGLVFTYAVIGINAGIFALTSCYSESSNKSGSTLKPGASVAQTSSTPTNAEPQDWNSNPANYIEPDVTGPDGRSDPNPAIDPSVLPVNNTPTATPVADGNSNPTPTISLPLPTPPPPTHTPLPVGAKFEKNVCYMSIDGKNNWIPKTELTDINSCYTSDTERWVTSSAPYYRWTIDEKGTFESWVEIKEGENIQVDTINSVVYKDSAFYRYEKKIKRLYPSKEVWSSLNKTEETKLIPKKQFDLIPSGLTIEHNLVGKTLLLQVEGTKYLGVCDTLCSPVVYGVNEEMVIMQSAEVKDANKWIVVGGLNGSISLKNKKSNKYLSFCVNCVAPNKDLLSASYSENNENTQFVVQTLTNNEITLKSVLSGDSNKYLSKITGSRCISPVIVGGDYYSAGSEKSRRFYTSCTAQKITDFASIITGDASITKFTYLIP